MVYIPLTFLPTPCANIPSSFANECFQTLLCLLSFIICLYSIDSPISGSMMEFATSWLGEALPSNLYCTSVTPRPENICVSSVSVKCDKMYIYSCGIILDFLSLELYLVAKEDGMIGAGVWCVPTLGDGELIMRYTLGGTGVYTLGGSGSLAVCSTLEGAQGCSSGLEIGL